MMLPTQGEGGDSFLPTNWLILDDPTWAWDCVLADLNSCQDDGQYTQARIDDTIV